MSQIDSDTNAALDPLMEYIPAPDPGPQEGVIYQHDGRAIIQDMEAPQERVLESSHYVDLEEWA